VAIEEKGANYHSNEVIVSNFSCNAHKEAVAMAPLVADFRYALKQLHKMETDVTQLVQFVRGMIRRQDDLEALIGKQPSRGSRILEGICTSLSYDVFKNLGIAIVRHALAL
jgi:hypothetical protein